MRGFFVAASLLGSWILSSPAWAWDPPKCETGKGGNKFCYTTRIFSFNNEQRAQEAGIGVFSTESGPGFAFIIGDFQWNMKDRSNLEAKIRVDNFGLVARSTFTIGRYVVIGLRPDDLEYVSAGSMLHISLPSFSASYSLNGSRAAIQGILRAYANYGGRVDPFAETAPSDPFAGSATVTSPTHGRGR